MHTGIVHTCIHTCIHTYIHTLKLVWAVGTCTQALYIHAYIHIYMHAYVHTYIHTKMTTLHNYQRLTKAPGNHIPRPKLSDLIGLFIATECNRQKKQMILVV